MGFLWLAVALFFLIGISSVSSPAEADEEPDNESEDRRWAELESADQNDRYWDPPGDNV